MTKAKYLIILFVTAVFMLFIPNASNAAVEYTRTIPSNEGTIKINFTGLELDVMKAYEFALVRQGGTPEYWYAIDDGYTTSEASITLSSATSRIVEVLRATDIGFIYIREKDNTTGTYVLQAQQVNLKLPYLQSLAYVKSNNKYGLTNMIYGTIGNIYEYTGGDHTYSIWKKITDRSLIEEFLSIKNNNGNITELEESLPNPPTTGYTTERATYHTDKNDGLYLLWVKRTGENCKDVYSCIVHDGLPDATKVEEYLQGLDVEKPTVESIVVTNPVSGIYKTGQAVKIAVTFSEDITGTTVPTLKIRFGTSEERTVTNGTISKKQITYTYTIVDSDVGQLAVTGYSGGTIKDASGNDAIISSKTIGGYTIKANVNDGSDSSNQNPGTGNNDDEDIDKKTYGSHEYQIIKEKMTWKEAKAYCEKQEGYLVTINSKEEQAFITKYVKDEGLTENRFWIGATDEEKDGTWKWITGEKFSYSNWSNEQPDDKEAGGQDYAVYLAYRRGYKEEAEKWDDINNDSESDIYFICEWGEYEKDTNDDAKNDPTTSKKPVPNTGKTIALSSTVIAIIALVIFGYIKNRSYKEIK